MSKTTNTASASTEADPELLKQFGFKVWSYKQGEMVSLMLHIGDRLELFTKLAELVDDPANTDGTVTSAELASAARLNERLIREWLLGMAAAEMITYHNGATENGAAENGTTENGAAENGTTENGAAENGTFSITPEAKALLVDEKDSVQFAMGAFRGGTESNALDLILESFKTGIGMTYEQQGPRAAAGLARTTGPFSRQALTSTIIDALDGVKAKLENGGKVLDVGCGAGVSACLIAEAWPQAKVIGCDPSAIAIGQARERAKEHGLSNVEFVEASAAEITQQAAFGGGAAGTDSAGSFDLTLTFDCLHDMPFPDEALNAIREALNEDGTLLIKEIRSRGNFEQDRRNPMLAMFYGFSVSSCLQSAMSEPGGMALGTFGMHPDKARQLTSEAGFSRFKEHDFADPANVYYEVRP